jgi:hypothetical protein
MLQNILFAKLVRYSLYHSFESQERELEMEIERSEVKKEDIHILTVFETC